MVYGLKHVPTRLIAWRRGGTFMWHPLAFEGQPSKHPDPALICLLRYLEAVFIGLSCVHDPR